MIGTLLDVTSMLGSEKSVQRIKSDVPEEKQHRMKRKHGQGRNES